MKIFYIISGISLVFFGVGIINDPVFNDTKHNYIIDFTDIKWPFGVFLVLLGIGTLFFTLRKRPTKINTTFLMCLECRTPFSKNDVSGNKCPTCATELEPLAGFYERHPELRDR